MYCNYGFTYVLFHIIWVFLVIALIIWLVRLARGGGYYHNHHNFPRHGNRNAIDILNERYAKGEINKEEYEQKKKDLMQ